METLNDTKMRKCERNRKEAQIFWLRSTWLRIGYEFRRMNRRREQSDRFHPDYNIGRTRLSRRPIS